MIITLITLVVLTVGIILLVMKNKAKDYHTERILDTWGFGLTALGVILGFFISLLIISNVISSELSYQNTLHEKEMIEYRIERMEDNVTGNEMLYNDIVEFNNNLRSTKKWANNPLVNWFNNQKVASIDYIVLDDM